jgi:hypothetical protein
VLSLNVCPVTAKPLFIRLIVEAKALVGINVSNQDGQRIGDSAKLLFTL